MFVEHGRSESNEKILIFHCLSLSFRFFLIELRAERVHMDARQQFVAALNEFLAELEASGDGHVADVGFISLRLETLSETALLNGDIPMTVIDVLNQARQQLNKSTESTPYSSYAAPVLPSMGRRGRPKFDITEDQLKFFRGRCRFFGARP